MFSSINVLFSYFAKMVKTHVPMYLVIINYYFRSMSLQKTLMSQLQDTEAEAKELQDFLQVNFTF